MKYFYLFITVLLISCGKPTTSNENSTETIAWIQEFIQQTKQSPFPTKVIITQYTYKGETVFLINHCYQCADEMKVLYTRDKKKLSTFGGMLANQNKLPNFFEEATEKKELWRSF